MPPLLARLIRSTFKERNGKEKKGQKFIFMCFEMKVALTGESYIKESTKINDCYEILYEYRVEITIQI